MKLSIGLTVATIVLGLSAAGCGDDEPAVCSAADDLRTSIEDLREIEVIASGGIDELENGLETVEANFASVRSEAQSEFATQVDAVETSTAELRSAVDDAKADPTATTLAAAASALSAFGTDVDSLIDDVRSTC